MKIATANILQLLENVKDPEIPVLSVVDMGIIRGIREAENSIEIDITPTYTGCPAMDMIERNIVAELTKNGYPNVTVKTVLSPPWTTDWITADAKKRLEEYGIAPPIAGTADKRALFAEAPKPRCPHCKSPNTKMVSAFGSTACKAQYTCEACKEPFDYFKCI
jgi:ring-1,2-phenylacetyl-CoA epoxidase subunit PaaD